MTATYVSAVELKATLELSGETFADNDIDLAVSAASRSIDNLCGRRFWPDADATQVRYYTPEDRGCLNVDDLVELTSLKTDPGGDGTFDETWSLDTDFVLLPLNAATDGRPWMRIEAHPNGSYRMPVGFPRSVKITGKFGWTAVPDEIKLATTVLASKLMRRAREAPFGVVAFGLDSGAAMRIARSDPDVMGLISSFDRTAIAVA